MASIDQSIARCLGMLRAHCIGMSTPGAGAYCHGVLGVRHRVLGVLHRVLGVQHRVLGVRHRVPGVLHRVLGNCPVQCLHRHSHTNRTLDPLSNVDRPPGHPQPEPYRESRMPWGGEWTGLGRGRG